MHTHSSGLSHVVFRLIVNDLYYEEKLEQGEQFKKFSLLHFVTRHESSQYASIDIEKLGIILDNFAPQGLRFRNKIFYRKNEGFRPGYETIS